MAWAKIDDQLHAHPKPNRAYAQCPASLGLQLLAMSYTACFNLDGFVDEVFVASKIPSASLRRKAVQALEDAGVWDRVEGGWTIHDWADYNDVAVSREQKRQAKVEAGKKGAAARWGTDNGSDGEPMAGAMAPDTASGSGSANGTAIAPSPSPNRELGEPSSQRARVRFNGKVVPEARLEVAETILEDFNRREGTRYNAIGAGGKPTEPFKRILGALVERPHIGPELGKRVNEVCLGADRFWEGPAQPGNVWGPNVVDRNVARAMGAGRNEGDDWLGAPA